MQEKQIKDVFSQASKENKKIILTDFSSEHNLYLTRMCIPLEHIPPISENGSDYYYFWDPESDIGERIFGRTPSDIKHMELSNESFNPNDYIVHHRNDA